MKSPLIALLVASLFLASPTFAQTPADDASTAHMPTNDAWILPEDSILNQAMTAPPPRRSSFARRLAASPDELQRIDQWIENTAIDAPQNLILRDILLAMPVTIAGPKLVALARKTSDEALQERWMTWLQKYPDAFESVLQSWIQAAPVGSAQFLNLLTQLQSLDAESAEYVWAQVVRGNAVKKLGALATFGHAHASCRTQIAALLETTWNTMRQRSADASPDVPEILRLMHAFSRCPREVDTRQLPCAARRDGTQTALANANATPTSLEIAQKLLKSTLSRRIVALDFAGKLPALMMEIDEIYETAKNTTEKAHALRALHDTCTGDALSRTLNALRDGDETLRFEAASLIADYPLDDFPKDQLQSAFERETWPDTQIQLYRALISRSTPDESADFRRAILLDNSRALPLRQVALDDILEKDASTLDLSHFSKLLAQGDPLDLIAPVAERLYETHPTARPTLRDWIVAQQPLDRRLAMTLARFILVDTHQNDTTGIDLMRNICDNTEEQAHILRPCLFFFESNAQTPDDQARRERLQRQTQQRETMLNFDFE